MLLRDQTIETSMDWPAFDQEMIDAVGRVLRSGKVSYGIGDEGRSFEAEFAQFLGVGHAVAVANGTAALDIALEALGIGGGDEVVVTPRSFIASASCVVRRGAAPVFADVDPDSGNLTARSIEAALTSKTRAVLIVHLGGWPCDMVPIVELVHRHGLLLIEDVAQAVGGTNEGRPLGSFGDAAAFSFCNDKIISTGEGGLVAVDDEAVFKRAWGLRDHGTNWDVMHAAHPPGFIWSRHEFGGNARMPETAAAIGRIALRRLADWRSARRRNAKILEDRLGALPGLRMPATPEGHAYYRIYAYLRPERLRQGWSRDRILGEIQQHGVKGGVGGCGEIYREKAFVDAGLAPPSPLPVAHDLAETSLAFAVHPTLTPSAMHMIADVVESVVDRATD